MSAAPRKCPQRHGQIPPTAGPAEGLPGGAWAAPLVGRAAAMGRHSRPDAPASRVCVEGAGGRRLGPPGIARCAPTPAPWIVRVVFLRLLAASCVFLHLIADCCALLQIVTAYCTVLWLITAHRCSSLLIAAYCSSLQLIAPGHGWGLCRLPGEVVGAQGGSRARAVTGSRAPPPPSDARFAVGSTGAPCPPCCCYCCLLCSEAVQFGSGSCVDRQPGPGRPRRSRPVTGACCALIACWKCKA